VAWETFPGNMADKPALTRMVNRLRNRFQIKNVAAVADRVMISKDTIKQLVEDNDSPYRYMLGCRMRRQKEVNEEVLAGAGRYQVVADNLEAKEAGVAGRTYIVCRNPGQVIKDQADREAIIEKIQKTIAEKGPKALEGNRGCARFLKIDRGSVSINPKAVEADARLDGEFVLITNTDLPAAEVAETYKGLWRVERTFREQKSTLEIRPIYHQCPHTSIGHIAASFLALRLEVDLTRRLDERKIQVSWPDLMRDLAQVQSIIIDLEGSQYRLRTNMAGSSYQAFKAAGVRPPETVSLIGPSPPSTDPTSPTQMSFL